MKLREIKINNFRLLANSNIDLDDKLTWIVGKNNTGKTSFLILLDYFFKNFHIMTFQEILESICWM